MALRNKVSTKKKSKTNPVEPALPPPVPFDPTALINKVFPNKATLVRKILPLWASFYRVNYHDTLNSNYVSASHFILIRDNNEILEYN